MKQVFVEWLWKGHPALMEQFNNPPEGYSYITKATPVEGVARSLSQSSFGPTMMLTANKFLPANLMRTLQTAPLSGSSRYSFTYSVWHPVLRKAPWVMEVSSLNDFAYYEWQRRLLMAPMGKLLARAECKLLICWYEDIKRDMHAFVSSPAIVNKTVVVPRAVPRRVNQKKQTDSELLRLLFVGSTSQVGEFEPKGGAELLRAFSLLSSRLDNIRLTIRSDVPSRYVDLCRRNPKIELFTEPLPRKELDRLYDSADIFVYPSHYAAWGVILEAMSYGLPVIVCDVYGIRDIVSDGVDGFIISDFAADYCPEMMKSKGKYPEYLRGLGKPDPVVTQRIVDCVTLLASDPGLRSRLSGGALKRVASQNSLERQRSILRRLFDEITQ